MYAWPHFEDLFYLLKGEVLGVEGGKVENRDFGWSYTGHNYNDLQCHCIFLNKKL